MVMKLRKLVCVVVALLFPAVTLPSELFAQRRGYPWVNLADAVPLPQPNGAGAGSDVADPRALAAGDLDGDGIDDLIAGFATDTGGLLRVYKGNVDAIFPDTPEAEARRRKGTFSQHPFPYQPQQHVLPAAPDFVTTGDFDNDGKRDVLTAMRGDTSLYLLSGDGNGRMGSPRQIPIPGAITALIAGEVNRADGSPDLVVGLADRLGGTVLIFQSAAGTFADPPATIRLSAPPAALALGQLDDDYPFDLAIAAGIEVLIVHGIDSVEQAHSTAATMSLALQIDSLRVQAPIEALVLDDFAGDSRNELAVLDTDGVLRLLGPPQSMQSPASRGGGEGTARPSTARVEPWWQSALPVLPLASGPGTRGVAEEVRFRTLAPARLSSFSKKDILVIDPSLGDIQIVHQLQRLSALPEPVASLDREGLAPEALAAAGGAPLFVETDGRPVAALPMRLNIDGASDLVLVQRGGTSLSVSTTQSAATFLVDSEADSHDKAPGDGKCEDSNFECTLRAAIEEANKRAGDDTITFAPNVQNIVLSPLLWWLPHYDSRYGAFTIDGGATRPLIDGSALVLDPGESCPQYSCSGLEIGAGGVVRNVVVSGFREYGIFIYGNDVRVEGCYAGTDRDGTREIPNRFGGVMLIGGTNTIIGGTAEPARNVLSGNGSGVEIASSGNQVVGNFIGIDAAGFSSLGNSVGVEFSILNARLNNIIRGNVISGNSNAGILLSDKDTAGTLVQDNRIGTNDLGNRAMPNGVSLWRQAGVVISDEAHGNTIGGTAAGTGNVISGNGFHGVLIADEGTTGNLIQGNWIGTNIEEIDLGNDNDG
ncbi:MAG: hypothetical protein H6Q33_4421, partial [Deltaproteobacteria bacterium]|nr:hypothetical protein [Deltaproteobacteria bacterium]